MLYSVFVSYSKNSYKSTTANRYVNRYQTNYTLRTTYAPHEEHILIWLFIQLY